VCVCVYSNIRITIQNQNSYLLKKNFIKSQYKFLIFF
jgi:hypothetical protein